MVSRHEIASKYKIKDESIVYELLGFKKTALDDIDDLKKSIPTDKLDALLEHELRVRFGIGIEDIRDRLGETDDDDDDGDDPCGEVYEFPTARVKNWDALRKHAAEMLCYADPVKYDYAVRKVRVSNKPKEIRAYLYNMYRYSGIYKYACQMCHDSCASVEIAEIFNKPETELDPMNLCLCPNCATKYRAYRNNESLMKELLAFILNAKVKDSELDYVEVPVEEDVLWFTQVHFAEIQELIKLADEAKNANKKNDSEISPDDSEVESGTSVYKSLIGKRVKRKDGFEAEVIDLEEKKDGTYLVCKILNGPKINQETKIQLSFILSNPNVYQIKELLESTK
jgi:protein-arginine kinase activator protein McsA